MQKLEGFTWATALDLNMGYYHIKLDPDAQKICTIVFPWGKYQYLRLPMGIHCAPDMFQEQMYEIMSGLNFIKTYLDDLLMMTSDTLDDHLRKLELVLDRLKANGLKVNAEKSTFCATEIEYLGYRITRDGIQPLPKKVQAILDLEPPTNLKELRRVLGIVQYYRDIWQQRSHILAPLTELVGKVKRKFKWERVHQESFKTMKKIVSRDVLLAYQDFNVPFEIYTDASDRQLGAVITQNG